MPEKRSMTDRLDAPSEPDRPEDGRPEGLQGPPPMSGPSGLLVRGFVMRRTRRMVGNDEPREVVTYTLGPRLVTFEHWQPTRFHAVGELVELEVVPSVWNGRVTFLVPRAEEEF
jgi:hypothetical protein